MLVHIPQVLNTEQVSRFRRELDAADFADGRATAGYQSARVKLNGQLAETDPLAMRLGADVADALSRNALFFSAALPRHVFPPLFNRYQFGQGFGWRQTGTLTGLQQAANQGAVGLIVARRKEDGRLRLIFSGLA